MLEDVVDLNTKGVFAIFNVSFEKGHVGLLLVVFLLDEDNLIGLCSLGVSIYVSSRDERGNRYELYHVQSN